MLYDIGFLIFSLIYLPTLIFKGKLHGDFAERFARYGKDKLEALSAARDVIWIQAVSVGEVAVCKSLMPLLRERFPASTIVMSTITKTGNDLAKKLYAGHAVIIYFPLDFSFIVKRAVRLIRPKLYVMIETEIWPNLLAELSRGGTPSILVNGRISDRSIGKYRLVKGFLKMTLGRIDLFCMQSKTDAYRIIELGAQGDTVRVTGNMKFDLDIKTDTRNIRKIRTSLGLGDTDRLFVAGSTHPGEEAILVAAFKELAGNFPGLRLLIAPRHVERTGEVEAVVRQFGFEPVRVSEMKGPRYQGPGPRVLILDTIGRLNDMYAVAELVFIGGSLIRHGGQNPIEEPEEAP